jgi:hypothetical protein
VGTPVSLNDPSAPVNAKVTKEPIDVSHELQVLVPGWIVGSAAGSFGTKTRTFCSGFLPAGSNTVPTMVVGFAPQFGST